MHYEQVGIQKKYESRSHIFRRKSKVHLVVKCDYREQNNEYKSDGQIQFGTKKFGA